MLFAFLLLNVGCNESTKSKTTTMTLCDTNRSTTLNAATLNVLQNTITTTTEIIDDMNKTLHKMDSMNKSVLKTVELSTDMVTVIAKDFAMSPEGQSLFEADTSLPGFIPKKPLDKNYILVSSPNRFFPETKSIKTLFNNPATLTNALNRALDAADKSKNLYMTIIQVETNATLTNLTNGLLIKSSQLP